MPTKFTHVVTGLAGESPYDDLTEKHKGKRVWPYRRCINQDTTICETEDGGKLWVKNGDFKEVKDARLPE